MRYAFITGLVLGSTPLLAQVEIDRPVRFTGADSTAWQVQGLAAPTQEDALVTAGQVRGGDVVWAQVAGTAQALLLTLDPAPTAYRNGLLIRFLPVASSKGTVTANVNGLGAMPVVRGDRLPVAWGEMEPGQPVEMEFRDSLFVLLGRAGDGCPTGFLPANGRYCLQTGTNPALNFYNASAYCMSRGARLCTWDEYFYACSVLQPQLTGLFDDWEWIDDTSDHTHTADQSGRWQCRSQRSIGALVTETATFRCCYQRK